MRLAALLCLMLWTMMPGAQAEAVRIGVLMHASSATEDPAALRSALEQALDENPAFIVVNGLKGESVPCKERLFRERKALLEAVAAPVFLSMAGSDWMACRDRQGRPAASFWLSLLRDQLYGDISWNGSKQLTLKRQSSIPAFRSYAENTRWAWQNVLLATLHMPADNNHFLAAAGSNSEFEDRLTANRDWIKRLATQGQAMRAGAIVIFSDGEAIPPRATGGSQRDGFMEMRAALKALADRVSVPVLIVQGSLRPEGTGVRRWGKLFYATLPQGVSHIAIDSDSPSPFSIVPSEAAAY